MKHFLFLAFATLVLAAALFAQVPVELKADTNTHFMTVWGSGSPTLLMSVQVSHVFNTGSGDLVAVAPRVVAAQPGTRVYIGAWTQPDPDQSAHVTNASVIFARPGQYLTFTVIDATGNRIIANYVNQSEVRSFIVPKVF